MSRTLHLLVAAAALTCVATPLAAQDSRFTADLRGEVAFPIEKLHDAELNTGLGFGATLAVRLQPHLHMYGGWDWLHFASKENSFGGDKADFEETGYTLGLRFQHPFREPGTLQFRVEGGATYKHVEVENTDGDIILDSGHSAGFEGGAGLVLPYGRWQVVGMIRGRSLSPEFTVANTTTKGTLRYVGIELGGTVRF